MGPSHGQVRRFLRFGFVGGLGTLVNLSLLTLFTEFLGWHYLLAAAISIEASTLFNFAFNRAFTWRDQPSSWKNAISYHAVVGTGVAIQFVVLALAASLMGIDPKLAMLAGIAAGTLWNFVGNDRLTFGRPDPVRNARLRRIALYGGAFVLQLALAAVLTHDWDTFVFQNSVEQFLQSGTTPYEVGTEKPDYIYMGVGLPVQPLWYAYPALPLLMMSATYWPAALGFVDQPWLARILIKLPFILGNLVLAAIAHRFVAGAAGSSEPETARKAAKLEKFLLFNPVLILVASIWGMFESVLLAALIGSVLALRREKWALGGALWGVAALVKIFPVFLVPVLAIHLWRRGGSRAFLRYFLAAGATFVAVSLPFLLTQPQGYLEQVFLMHGRRTPGRFAPIAVLYESLRLLSNEHPGLLPTDQGLAQALSFLSFAVTAFLLVMLAAVSARRPATERQLLYWSGASMLAALLATKVLSEQYLLLPLVLLAVYLFHPGAVAGESVRAVRRVVLALTVCVSLVVPLDNLHALLFLPPDVASYLFGLTVPQMIMSFANWLGLTVFEAATVANGIALTVVFVPFVLGARLLGPPLREAFSLGSTALHSLLHAHPMRRPTAKAIAIALIALLAIPTIVVGVSSPRREIPPPDSGVVDGPMLLAHYRSDWFNPTNRFEVQAGNWIGGEFTPTYGFYNSYSHKMQEDFQGFQELGFDAVILEFDPVFEARARSARNVGESFHLPYALEIDLADVADSQGRFEFTEGTADDTAELFNGAAFDFWQGGYHLRLGSDHGPLVFVRGMELAAPSFSDSERQYVSGFLTAQTGTLLGAAAPTWRDAPTSMEQLQAPESAAWREAWALAEDDWWSRVLPGGTKDAPFDLVIDAEPRVGLEALGRVRIAGFYDPVGRPSSGRPSEWNVRTADANPLDVAAFDASWRAAFDASAEGLIVPWNDFDLGHAIEPTLEGGTVLFNRTQDWTHRSRSTAE